MVDSTGLENRNSRKAIEGSNPSASASDFLRGRVSIKKADRSYKNIWEK